jgi:uncharacterized protein YbjT (DUF2867 family)
MSTILVTGGTGTIGRHVVPLPQGLVADLVGPKVYSLSELAHDYLRATGKRRPSLPIHVPGKAGKVYRAGANLTLSGATVGTHTWDEFVASQV